jgi:hypothetical protein
MNGGAIWPSNFYMKSLLPLFILGLLSSATVKAAPVELAASTEGSGSVQIGSSGDRVSKANVVLKRNGTFSIGLVGGNDTRFSGTWIPSGRESVALKLSEADGRDARGSGELNLRARRGDYEIDNLALSGENEKGRSINARFNAPRYVPAPPPPPVPRVVLDSERDGLGKLQVGGRDNYRVAHLRVQLFTNGRAHVRAEGAAVLRYEGTWTPAGETTANLDVRGGLDGERMQGIVRHRAGRFWRIELTGTRAGRYHSLEFEPVR